MKPLETPEVLVIEDDGDTRELLEEALSSAGFRVSTASSGADGLAWLHQHLPDLVLLDQNLPGMSGTEVCQAIRRSPGMSAVPVIMLTALSQPRDKVSGLQAGADDYITKPFDVDELVARLHSHVRRTRRERHLNPLTGLPGNLSIDSAIEAYLAGGKDFAVAWTDLDNFKVYNDRYGFFAGDDVIERTGKLLLQVVERLGSEHSFAGHIGGDDFILVMPLDAADLAGRMVVEGFDRLVPEFYNPDDRERGFIAAVSRTGDEKVFPLMSVSVAIVPCPASRFAHPAEIAHVATEIKHFLKQRPGSAWLVDRRAGEADDLSQQIPDTGLTAYPA